MTHALSLLCSLLAAGLVGACAESTKLTGPLPADGGRDAAMGGSAGTGTDGAPDAASDVPSDSPPEGGGGAPNDAGPAPCRCGEPDCGTCPAVEMASAGGYSIDSIEVTGAAYGAFLATDPSTDGQPTECDWNSSFTPSSDWPPSDGNRPVVFVDQCDAQAYCRWAGKRLCGAVSGGSNAFGDFADANRSQWHNACSGAGTRTYPYGGAYVSTACNGADQALSAPRPNPSAQCEGGFPGLWDMSGNVWEWEDSCSASDGKGDNCRMRGGSFEQGAAALSCSTDAALPRDSTAANVGFRCCS